VRFMMIYRTDERRPDAFNPSAETIAGMGRLMGEMAKAGVLLEAEGLRPSSAGARVTFAEGKRVVVDGPFAEAKEVIAGFALLQVKSKEEAIEWSSRFADVIGEVEVEIRQVTEMSDLAPPVPPQ
jgi:hypothetical protein